MNKRYLGALLLSPLLLLLFIGDIYLKYFIMILSLAGMYEFYNAAKKKNINCLKYLGYLLCILYYIMLNRNINFQFIFLLLIFIVFIMLCIPIININYNFIDVAVTILGFLYIAVFFSFIILIYEKTNGSYLIWIVFLSSWLCDTTAYYAGRYLGKNKLCPKISPNKTIEGSIGGLIGSTVACAIFGLVIGNFGVKIAIYNYILIGILCGVFCQFGDLAASSIKRYANVKDYSNLIPGHGGILDRFDSILFASVIVYYYITFIIGI